MKLIVKLCVFAGLALTTELANGAAMCKNTSWWTDSKIVPSSGYLLGDNWTIISGKGLSNSWILRDTSRGYEFRGWYNCTSGSNEYSLSNTLNDNNSCWCKVSDPVGGSWEYGYLIPVGASDCANGCGNICAQCLYSGSYGGSCKRDKLLKA